MGALQEIFTGNRSNDVVCASGYNRMIPLDLWVKKVNASLGGKSGPVKIITISKTEADRILDELGVIRRGPRSVNDVCGVSGSLYSSNVRRIPSVGKALEVSP